MIEFKQAHKTFGSLHALSNIDLTLQEGQSIALIGPNGCGKSTLIKSILGLVKLSSGKILVDGMDISNSIEYKKHIGYMPQIGRYPENMTIGQVLHIVSNLRPETAATDFELIETYGLQSIQHKKMGTLSGGTRQKVSAALAFLFDPKILILDEPTAGLDPIASDQLKEKIKKELAKGKLVLITSHMLAELDDLVTDLVFMQDGEIKIHENVEKIKSSVGHNQLSKALAELLKQSSHA